MCFYRPALPGVEPEQVQGTPPRKCGTWTARVRAVRAGVPDTAHGQSAIPGRPRPCSRPAGPCAVAGHHVKARRACTPRGESGQGRPAPTAGRRSGPGGQPAPGRQPGPAGARPDRRCVAPPGARPAAVRRSISTVPHPRRPGRSALRPGGSIPWRHGPPGPARPPPRPAPGPSRRRPIPPRQPRCPARRRSGWPRPPGGVPPMVLIRSLPPGRDRQAGPPSPGPDRGSGVPGRCGNGSRGAR